MSGDPFAHLDDDEYEAALMALVEQSEAGELELSEEMRAQIEAMVGGMQQQLEAMGLDGEAAGQDPIESMGVSVTGLPDELVGDLTPAGKGAFPKPPSSMAGMMGGAGSGSGGGSESAEEVMARIDAAVKEMEDKEAAQEITGLTEALREASKNVAAVAAPSTEEASLIAELAAKSSSGVNEPPKWASAAENAFEDAAAVGVDVVAQEPVVAEVPLNRDAVAAEGGELSKDEAFEDAITDAQDAFFTNDLPAAVSAAKKAIAIDPKVSDGYEMAQMALMNLGSYAEALDIIRAWQKEVGGGPRAVRSGFDVAYLAHDDGALVESAKALLALGMSPSAVMGVAGLLADAGLHDLAKSAVSAGEKEQGPEAVSISANSLNGVWASWIALKVGAEEEGLAGLNRWLEDDGPTLEAMGEEDETTSMILWKEATGTAGALLALHALEDARVPDAQKALLATSKRLSSVVGANDSPPLVLIAVAASMDAGPDKEPSPLPVPDAHIPLLFRRRRPASLAAKKKAAAN